MEGRPRRRAALLLGVMLALGVAAAPAPSLAETESPESGDAEARPASEPSATPPVAPADPSASPEPPEASATPPVAPADPSASPEPPEAAAEPASVSLAVLEFATNEPELKTEALSVAALVGQRIAQRRGARVVGPENAATALGERLEVLQDCLRADCAVEAGQRLEVGYVVVGRLDRLGKQFLLTASVSDAATGAPLARARETALEEIDFPYATDQLGDRLAEAMGLEKSSVFDLVPGASDEPVAHLNLKLGNTIAALKGFDISAFTLRFDVEADYYLRRYLLAFIEAGIAVGRASDDKNEPKGSFSLVPVTLGLKYVVFHQREVRPYAGLGLGLGLIADLVEPEERKLSLRFNGLMGLAYVPWRHLGFNLEASMNFDEMRVSGGSSLLLGFSFNFGVIAIF